MFSILKVLDDGTLHLVEEVDGLEAARERVAELVRFWPDAYVILDQATGEKLTITPGGEAQIN